MLKRANRKLHKLIVKFDEPLTVHAGEHVMLTMKGAQVVKAEVMPDDDPRPTAQEELNRRIREENSG